MTIRVSLLIQRCELRAKSLYLYLFIPIYLLVPIIATISVFTLILPVKVKYLVSVKFF